MLPQLIVEADACSLSGRWLLDPIFAQNLVELGAFVAEQLTPEGIRGPSLWIISGYRSTQLQAALNPAVENSCHTTCPAVAADLRLGSFSLGREEANLWAILGGWWKLHTAGRWGGDFSFPGSRPGDINVREMNHFDLGPCLGGSHG